MKCRITDDSSYDYSDYCEGKGYYAPYREDHRTEPEDDYYYDPDELDDAHLYPPMTPEDIAEALADVKARQAEEAERKAKHDAEIARILEQMDRQFNRPIKGIKRYE